MHIVVILVHIARTALSNKRELSDRVSFGAMDSHELRGLPTKGNAGAAKDVNKVATEIDEKLETILKQANSIEDVMALRLAKNRRANTTETATAAAVKAAVAVAKAEAVSEAKTVAAGEETAKPPAASAAVATAATPPEAAAPPPPGAKPEAKPAEAKPPAAEAAPPMAAAML